MGHRDFDTTLIYADYSPSADEAVWVERGFRGRNGGLNLDVVGGVQPGANVPSRA
jgi:hypothetical protein